MCILSFYRPGIQPNADRLSRGACFNPDGNGFAIIVGDRIHVQKSMNSEALIEAFCKIRRAHPDSYALFHSRITTDGETSVANCHPFYVGAGRQTVLAHNGILPAPARPNKDDPRSDTRILAEDLIPSGAFGHLTNRRARRRLIRWMTRGYPNKIAILTVDPAYGKNAYLLNGEAGEWCEGVWYSNNSHRSIREKYGTGAGYSWAAPSSRQVESMSWSDQDDYFWALYRRGDITYKEYLDRTSEAYDVDDADDGAQGETLRPMVLAGTGWPEGSVRSNYGNCPLCGSNDTVNLTVGYCLRCVRCVDCTARTAECQCFTPGTRTTWSDMAKAVTMGPPAGAAGEGN